MKKVLSALTAFLLVAAVLTGCSSSAAPAAAGGKEPDTITFAWLPNQAGEDFKDARAEIEKVVAEATGKKVEGKLTTDYAITIEAVASGNAQLAFVGAQQYIEAHSKNDKVLPLVVNTGASGTLKDALYYSRIAVLKGNEDQYKTASGTYAIDNIQGKKFSFVSNSSTSGFKVPSSFIITNFAKQDQWKTLKAEDLLEGGPGKFFSEVLFGGSHQMSLVNVLTGKSDVSAVDDVDVVNYVNVTSGTDNTEGCVYTIKEGAAEPFNTLAGKQFVIIKAIPVMNGPIMVNTGALSAETVDKIRKVLTSDAVANNPKVFFPKDSQVKGMFNQPARFVTVEDQWYDPIRKLSE